MIYNIQKHNDKAYLVLRQELRSRFEIDPNTLNKEYLKLFRDWVGANHVLQTPTHFIFCETIQDVEYEEID